MQRCPQLLRRGARLEPANVSPSNIKAKKRQKSSYGDIAVTKLPVKLPGIVIVHLDEALFFPSTPSVPRADISSQYRSTIQRDIDKIRSGLSLPNRVPKYPSQSYTPCVWRRQTTNGQEGARTFSAGHRLADCHIFCTRNHTPHQFCCKHEGDAADLSSRWFETTETTETPFSRQ